MSDDDEYGDAKEQYDEDESQEPMRPCEGFNEITGAKVLVGRAATASVTLAQAAAFVDHVRGLSLPPELRVIPDQDFSRMPDEDSGEPYSVMWAIGLTVMGADADDQGPSSVTLARVAERREDCQRLLSNEVWQQIAAGLPEDSRHELLAQADRLLLVTYGPLATGKVVFGVAAGRDDQAPPGLKRYYGCDMHQGMHHTVVHGVWVADSEWTIEEVDVSPEAHQQRVAQLGPLAGAATYHLISRYD